jgi:hypothetical protein
MSLGAGFYEELAFRVVLFGIGAKVLVWLFAHEKVNLIGQGRRLTWTAFVVMVAWALAASAVFSIAHYLGLFGDRFELGSFVFRFLLGLALTLIFTLRGFAAAVWAHSLYDVWVLVL